MEGGLRALAWLAGVVPRRAINVLGALLGWFVGSILRVRRDHVEAAMREAGIAFAPKEAAAMYRSLGASVWEFLRLSARGSEMTAGVAFEGFSRARWASALGYGRGVVVAASHTGNWDLVACAMARHVELLVITKRLSVRPLDSFWQSTRAAHGVLLADGPGALARARSVLARGGAVAMMIDQVPRPNAHAIEAIFLGRDAVVDRGPALLALACGAPLLVAASRRREAGDSADHLVEVLDVLQPPSRQARGRRAWVDTATIAATQALENFVRAHPSQWLWLHRRWKRLDLPAREATMSAACHQELLRSPRPATRSSLQGASSKAD
ncbi:MAG: lysophospholipid acyltransferase family protein [Myxococcota bacterium]|nr:lysophospholipid acyltransferase family protein [Myxococcota bacterium]